MSFAFMPLYTGDYLRDTRHLTPEEHGVYLLLIIYCWDQQGPLPLDERKLAGIANCRSGGEIESMRRVLAEFFVRMEDGHYQGRVQQEITKWLLISDQAKERGRRSAEARRQKYGTAQPFSESNSKAFRKASESVPNPPSPSPSPKKEIQLATLVVPEGDVYRPPNCPQAELLALYHKHCPTLPAVRIMTSARAAETTARWRQVCAAEKWGQAEGLDWFAWFFKRVNESSFLSGRHGGNRPWRADFQWLMKAGNFAKVVEGRYDREAA